MMKLRLAILALCCTAEAYAQPAHAPLEATGGTFTLGAETTLVADEGLFPLAEYAAEYLKCPVERQAAADGVLSLLIDPAPEAAAESYRLEITPDHITVRGADYGGVFNGLQALFRLLPPEIYAREGLQGPVTLPCGVREDAPKFAYRGMMLDVARTWIAPEALKRQIDLLAWHNINRLHIHLVDDEGWRIEIKSHPELAEVGGFRGGDSPIRPVYGKLDEKYGGYYTQDEMREIIRYAAVRNIEMIPEIDLPGHSRTIATLHPEIRCRFTPDTTLTAGYDDRSAWCVAREENYVLLEDILGEICDLFPSEYVHVGGDEVDMSQWIRCPDCQALMAREGMDDPHRLEDRFMERMSAILRNHGKRTAVWNEAVRTGNLSRAPAYTGGRTPGPASTPRQRVIRRSSCRASTSISTCASRPRRPDTTGPGSSTPGRSTRSTSRESASARSNGATSRGCRGPSGASSTRPTSPSGPTTSTTCSTRVSVPWRVWHGAATATAGSVTTRNCARNTIPGWRPWASATGSSRPG